MVGLLAGCSAAAPASQSASPSAPAPTQASPSPKPSGTPSPEPSVAPSQTPTPTASPTPRSTQTPIPPASPKQGFWSPPRLIFRGECSGLTATIDAAGRYHAAATCDGGIRYLTSTDGQSWIATSIVPGIDVAELDPQLTIDGDTVHLAFTRLAPEEGGCGDDGLRELGVIHQFRRLPAGEWSQQVKIGPAGDHIESFRVADGVVHATVRNDDRAFYVSGAGATSRRIAIPGALSTSLRVGDDGRARIAYTTGKALRLARVDGDRLATETLVTTSDAYVRSPLLVLGRGDRPLVAWMQHIDQGGGGCTERDPGPLDGTFFGSVVGGKWTSSRVSSTLGPASMTLDVSTGQVHLLIYDRTIRHYISTGDGSWTSSLLSDSFGMSGPLIRLNAVTGTIGILAIGQEGIHFIGKNPGARP